MLAAKTHVTFLNHLKNKFNLDKTDVYLATYETDYSNELNDIYGEKLLKSKFYKEKVLIGIQSLYSNIIDDLGMENIKKIMIL
jgi:hypothetical protein